jgi:hypothetical protein
VPGHERPLAQVLERIELCATLRRQRGDDLAAALPGRPPAR